MVSNRLAEGCLDVDRALRDIADGLFDEMARRQELQAMGATVAGVRFAVDHADVFNVGDARVYLESGGFATLITVDDRTTTGTQELTQSLGGTTRREYPSVHHHTIQLGEPFRLLACSDGLSEYVEFASIQSILAEQDPVRVVHLLVDEAVRRGAPDNVSVLVVDWSLDE
jgi:serine/threonine protein phosphatase PrpC